LTDSKEELKVKKADENKLSVYNPNNKLMKHTDIKEILGTYNVSVPSGIKPNYKIFHEAMTHKSYLKRKNLTPEDKKCAKGAVPLQKNSNERLQFLGDSIIHFIIGEHLYRHYEKCDEGFMTRLRCKLENGEALFYLAKQVGIDEYILLSQNIDVLYGNRNNINIVGGGLESFVGALYLTFGLGIAREFMLEVLRIELDIDKIAENETNYKEIISQMYIKNGWGNAPYKILKKEGPDHKSIFTMGLFLNGKLMTQGTANSKKAAEQIAAKKFYMSTQKQNQ
jgi:dsRNA-specific ribonuclease